MDLKQYVCGVPFANMELHERDNFMCCPSWLLKRLPSEVPVKDLWNSEEAKEIRKSIYDGSYKYCDKNQCPFLGEVLNSRKLNKVNPLLLKSSLPNFITDGYDVETGEMNIGPQMMQFSFDRSCNYKCPSCRVDVEIANSAKVKKVQAKIEEIETEYAKDITTLYITGSGDPFVSVGFRNFLRKFDPTKYPKLQHIHLHTNASMWNKEMWDSMKSIHKFVKTCEISIDAGTKETYENVTRLGGNWDNLISNLSFISTLPVLNYVKTSFVVQSCNYKEMTTFLDLMKSIFGKKVHVFFGKINNWGTFNEGEFKLLKVWDETHPEYNSFVEELNKVCLDYQVFHNMQEFVKIKKSLV
jgi:wyosine [tRNA(Phe)-imidazoG37] synthetase (radical SAM superfamily)